ncbi:SLC13 family permease [Nanoarchaeota archaeon]
MINYEIILVLAITIIAFYLFVREKFSVETVALLVMVILIVTKIVTPSEGVSGFSNPATITVLCMFIISAGIQKTGIVNKIGRKIFEWTKKSYSKQLLAITSVGPLSGFMNNTATVTVMIPIVMKLAEKSKIVVSKLLMPLSFICMAGGTLTLIGTTTNILSNDIYTRMGFGSIGLFEITKLGVIVLLITSIYFLTIGRFLLPKRKGAKDTEDPLRRLKYHTDVIVPEDSSLLYQKLKNNDLEKKFNIKILHIKRKNKIINHSEKHRIMPKDVLLIEGSREDLIHADDIGLIKIKASSKFPEKKGAKYKLVQFMISSKSTLINRTINSSQFRKKYNALVLGLKRGNEIIKKSIDKIRLKFGYILLLSATEKSIEKLKKNDNFIFVSEASENYNRTKVWEAFGILFLVLLLAAFNVFTIMVSALIGVVLMVILGVISFEESYESVNWQVVLLLAGIIPLGIAFEKTGAADLIANFVVGLSGSLSPLIVLGIFFILTTLLTEVVSNAASVIIIIPIAISVASQLSLNPLAFVITVMFAASTSFLTPIGYQTNTLVYSAGNYKFRDFFLVGLPLNIILLFVTVYGVKYFWGI